MSDIPIALTDPARELAELCVTLQQVSGEKGESFLAGKFGVAEWSMEFYQIIFTIVERCALLIRIVESLEMDSDFKTEITNHIMTISSAFSASAMRTSWSNQGIAHVGAEHVNPIKAISGLVRQKVAYRKLSAEEMEDLGSQVSALIEWLNERQLSDQDFIRQALIEGLEHFQFRMSKLTWLGWGYTLDSLREVISAYMLLERGGVDPAVNPDAAAILQKVGSVIKSVYAKVAAVKSVAETGDWLLKAYGAGSLIYQAGTPLISGLLSPPQ